MAGTPPAARRHALATYLGVTAVAGVVGFGAVYVMSRGVDNVARTPVEAGASRVTTAALPSGPGANALSKGQMAAFVFKKVPEALPEIQFVDAGGKPRSLKDWGGKVVLLNLWATWCAPCRKEMPALERLQKDLGGKKFEVVALAVDRTGIDGAKAFLDQIKVDGLELYADPQARAGTALKAIGMPTTLLLDAQGREIGRLVGPAKWDGEDAKRLIEAALKEGS